MGIDNDSAGWFVDPLHSGRGRYWDGVGWTDHTVEIPRGSVLPVFAPPSSPPPQAEIPPPVWLNSVDDSREGCVGTPVGPVGNFTVQRAGTVSWRAVAIGWLAAVVVVAGGVVIWNRVRHDDVQPAAGTTASSTTTAPPPPTTVDTVASEAQAFRSSVPTLAADADAAVAAMSAYESTNVAGVDYIINNWSEVQGDAQTVSTTTTAVASDMAHANVGPLLTPYVSSAVAALNDVSGKASALASCGDALDCVDELVAFKDSILSTTAVLGAFNQKMGLS